MGSPRTIETSKRFGQVGDYWGNVLLAEGEMEIDDEIVFEGDPAVYRVRRVVLAPLEPSKRLYYYERKDRHRGAKDGEAGEVKS